MLRSTFTATAIGVAYIAGHGFIGLLAVIAFTWATAMVSATNTAKTRGVENRVDATVAATAPAVSFIANGGTVNGNVTVAGDHHISGTLYGTSGTLTAGDNVYTSQALTAVGTITSHTAIRGSSTTGDGGQGSTLGNHDGDSAQGSTMGNQDTNSLQGAAPGAYSQSNCQAGWDRLNNLIAYHNGLVGDVQNLHQPAQQPDELPQRHRW